MDRHITLECSTGMCSPAFADRVLLGEPTRGGRSVLSVECLGVIWESLRHCSRTHQRPNKGWFRTS